jgi:hypothetical protein
MGGGKSVSSPVTVYQQVVCLQPCTRQALNSSAHGQHGGLQDVDAVNSGSINHGTATAPTHTVQYSRHGRVRGAFVVTKGAPVIVKQSRLKHRSRIHPGPA